MSVEHLKRFMDELGRDAALQQALAGSKNEDELIAGAVRLAAERGLEFTPSELEIYVRENIPSGDGELSDEQLGSVAGGWGLMTSVLTNIANMKHESLKGIAQNLRG